MNAVDKRKNMAILERMQNKLDFSSSSAKPSFDIVPKPPIVFTDYEIGGIYEQVVYVRNTGVLSRCARILPPGTIFFSMASVAFPAERGMVAPGMHIELRIRFAPDSRGDYKDSFTVQYETKQSVARGSTGTPGSAGSAQIIVPLMGRREPPELTLPLVVRAHNTFVGGCSLTSLVCKNLGGKGRFWLMTESTWSRLEHLQVASEINPTRSAVEMLGGEFDLGASMDVGPFRLSPNDIELEKGESTSLDLVYSPCRVGEQRERFVMVCDNCLVRVFQIVGRGCQVEVGATHVNDMPIDTTTAEMGALDRLFFPDEVLVNARAQQTIVLANDTPIDVKYCWRIEPLNEELAADDSKEKAMKVPHSEWTPPYRITPESGVFALSSSKEFRVEFLPVEARAYACQATLLINDIPACSMPGPGQMAHLKAAFLTQDDPSQSPRDAAEAAARKLTDEVPGLSIQLHGRGRLGSFTITPPLNDSWIPLEEDSVQLAGDTGRESEQLLQQDIKYSTTVVLQNQNDVPITFCWDLERLEQLHVAASAASTMLSATTDNPPSFDLALSPQTGELGPLGQQRIDLTFTPLCTGSFSLRLPCRIVTPNDANCPEAPRFERWLRLEGCVASAEIEIVTSKIDFGFVLVGASAEASITIRNPSRIVTTQWRFLRLEDAATSDSKESVVSSSGNETDRSSVVTSRATIAFAPENGQLAPGESFTVKATCMAGSHPEYFRGFFTCQAAPEQKFGGSTTQGACAAVPARAEIQCPNVSLSTTRLPLGTTYMDVEIHRNIELVNDSNLETTFKFVEPEGTSRASTITFAPQQGTIHSKERLVVTLNYMPRQLGRFTTSLACSVRGLPAPLCFEVTSNHKGLVLSYDLVQAPTPKQSAVERRTIEASTLMLPKSPKEIAMERGIPLSDCDLEPETNPLSSVPKLAFGSLPIGERRELCLLIRNFSGIEALVDLEAKKFPAAAAPSSVTTLSRQESAEFNSSSPTASPSHSKRRHKLALSKTVNSPKTSDKLTKSRLSDAKDQDNRYQSDNGRAYLRQGEDRQILRDGRGVAFHLSPARVHILPWEQVLVRVTCFSNMPGTYVDDIVSRAAGAPPVLLHASVRVVGTPLALDRNCVGLYAGKPVPEGRTHVLLQQPTLNFGDVCVRSPMITRTLRVENRGPQRARLKWKLVENGREDQLVTVTLRVDFGSRLQLRITPCDDSSSQAVLPFAVEPQSAMVPPFSTTSFRITFDPPKDCVGAPRVLLLADAHWYDTSVEVQHSESSTMSTSGVEEVDPRQEDSSPGTHNNSPTHAAGKAFAAVRMANAMARKPGPVIESSPASFISPKCLRVLLSADVIEPELFIDKPREHLQPPPPLSGRNTARKSSSAPTVSLPKLLAPYHIKFTTWSTLMTTSAAQHLFHRRELFLVNRLGSRVTFRLECEGPFAVAHADSLAPRHPLSVADLPAAHRRPSAQGESYMFVLPPQMSVRIDLRFLPSASLMTDSSTSSTLKSNSKLVQQQPLHARVDGELRVKFATKSVQTIRLAAVVLRPAIVVSPSVFFFGRVHLSASRSIILRLANPTVVPALFSIQHVPRPKPISRAQQQEMRQHHAHLTDEPGVFTFAQLSGELQGPTTTLKSAGGYLSTTDSIRDLLAGATTTHPLVHAPLELQVEFHPRQSGKRYKSRFRFNVQHGRDFEVVLEGVGHLDEVDNPRDGERPLVRVRELEHTHQIFRGTYTNSM
ncbi:uncharacterized protein PITG_09311 [Phytophthora infestans T30-4]|uniref:Deleted in lung and esophageal cancer protein 1 Ig-like domain-containing protein n=1 Tax=Phytophthora infestans (strain T30-4) TaxID=403677 RepID=D0NBE1_PHYIT|nr:uncharacterized protein PITG_09311 [Phytophthora infestans T30-4]EEY55370.1 conserved hypothetical protein [Phytophthora infestans T30-4]|eukprot:XP_002903594.1 conserved hypothetical protein [Phytophthora infestans T30-4]